MAHQPDRLKSPWFRRHVPKLGVARGSGPLEWPSARLATNKYANVPNEGVESRSIVGF